LPTADAEGLPSTPADLDSFETFLEDLDAGLRQAEELGSDALLIVLAVSRSAVFRSDRVSRRHGVAGAVHLRSATMNKRWMVALVVVVAALGCGDDSSPATDAGPASRVDASTGDAGGVVADDAGTAVDAGSSDAGSATADAGPITPGGDPTMPGAAAVTESSDDVVRGDRTTPVVAYVPAGAGPFPLVLFAPGFQLESSRYAALCERVASHGFVVVRADPPASLFGVSHTAMRDDMAAVLDWALAGSLPVDSTRVGAMGHSLGGKVSTMLAGADARVTALLGIDPVNGGMPSFIPGGDPTYTADLPDVVPEVTAALTIPVGYLGETTNGSGGVGGMACAPTDQNFQTFYEGSTSAPYAAEWDFTGADHMDFVPDKAGCGFTCSACTAGTADESAVLAGTYTLAVAFFRQALVGEDMNAWLTGASVPAGVSARSR